MTSISNCADFVMIASYDVHIYLNLFDTYICYAGEVKFV